MEVVLVQLAYEAGEVAVLEMFGEYGFGESLILLRIFLFSKTTCGLHRIETMMYLEDHKAVVIISPPHNIRV